MNLCCLIESAGFSILPAFICYILYIGLMETFLKHAGWEMFMFFSEYCKKAESNIPRPIGRGMLQLLYAVVIDEAAL